MALASKKLAARVHPRHCSENERRRQLIDAAEDVFLESGYHLATMDDIARRAGVSKKTIYVIFSSKMALFDALLAERLAPFAAPIPDEGRPMAQVLTEYLTAVARLALSPRQLALTRLMIAESPRSPDIGRALGRQAVCNGDSGFEVWLARQAARGMLALDDPQEAAAMLFGMSIGELMLDHLIKNAPPLPAAEVAHRIKRAVAIFLRAFARTQESEQLAR